MKWVILTCDATKKIVPAQEYLLKKYVPHLNHLDLQYVDLGNQPVKTWTTNVLNGMSGINDEYIIFGLDDYLPIDYFNYAMFKRYLGIIWSEGIDRFELGWGASKKKGFRKVETVKGNYLRYGSETPYNVSCQFSVWRTSALKTILYENPNWTPWQFEVRGKVSYAACSEEPVFRWIEESAISNGRHPGKVNILGLQPYVVDELIKLGHIKKEECQYGMPRGVVPPFDPKNVGKKYQEFYV